MRGWSFDLIATAFRSDQIPPHEVPEVAVAGRSNVGKSTLINSLFNRTSKKIAHVSSHPGKTRSLNFYRVSSPASGLSFSLIDLPGYGYAARSEAERRGWWRLIDDLFSDADRVAFAIHLIDFRHGPQRADRELISWLDRIDMPRLTVFTKCDKVPRGQRNALYRKYLEEVPLSLAPPPMTCGKNDEEIDRLRESIEHAVSELCVS